jgi:hypothetical protein
MKLLIIQFHPVSYHLIPLRSKYSPQLSVLKHLQSRQSLPRVYSYTSSTVDQKIVSITNNTQQRVYQHTRKKEIFTYTVRIQSLKKFHRPTGIQHPQYAKLFRTNQSRHVAKNICNTDEICHDGHTKINPTTLHFTQYN